MSPFQAPEPRLAPAQLQVPTGQIGRPLLWRLEAEVGVKDAGYVEDRRHLARRNRWYFDKSRNTYGFTRNSAGRTRNRPAAAADPSSGMPVAAAVEIYFTSSVEGIISSAVNEGVDRRSRWRSIESNVAQSHQSVWHTEPPFVAGARRPTLAAPSGCATSTV